MHGKDEECVDDGEEDDENLEEYFEEDDDLLAQLPDHLLDADFQQ
jgi:hypothetical protein